MMQVEIIEIDEREWVEFSADTVEELKTLKAPLHLNEHMVHPYRRDMLVEYPVEGDKTRLRFRMAFASEVI